MLHDVLGVGESPIGGGLERQIVPPERGLGFWHAAVRVHAEEAEICGAVCQNNEVRGRVVDPGHFVIEGAIVDLGHRTAR